MNDFESGEKPTLSIVVPLYNEEENVFLLLDSIHNAMSQYRGSWELLLIDDGSSDQTARLLRKHATQFGQHIRVLELQRNYGQTAAMQAGFDESRGEIIATLDGDLQNDPSDIPRMVEELLNRDLDLLTGWRKERQDDLLLRKIPSRIANLLIGKITGVKIHDYGCSLKIYRASVIKQISLYGEMHRFIPAWVAAVVPPSRIGECIVSHNPRIAGQSKYGISRTFRVILDLLSVYFFMSYRDRPGHFFGMIGLILSTVGGLALIYLGILKFGFGESIGQRPLFIISIVCIIASLQFFTTGIMTEMISRTYYESSRRRQYVIYHKQETENLDDDVSWCRTSRSSNTE